MKYNSPGRKRNRRSNGAAFGQSSSARGSLPREKAQASKKVGRPRLFYFFLVLDVSRSSLREAARESAAGGAVMVLAGPFGRRPSRETASRISKLIGKSGTETWIDPLLFECFSVGSVPQLVLAYSQPAGTDCEGAPYIKVSGDVSLPYALGLMEKEDANAGIFIKRLEESGFYRD